MSESDRKTGWAEFLAEARRRRVVRFALAYAAGAFVVLQLAEIVLPAFGVGDEGLRWLVVATTLGFPPSLVLAWVYDLTRDGVRRTEDGRSGPLTHRVAIGALLLATIAATGGLGMYLARQGASPTPEIPEAGTPLTTVAYDPAEPIRSIAVLPLDDYSPDADQAYFAASMHEELVAKLSMLDELRVVSRTTVMRYTDTVLDIPTIGRELNVDVIVEGSVTRTPERTRVTLQLIHAPSDSHIETLQWDREEVADVLAFQTEIAQGVVEVLADELDPDVLSTAAADVDPEAQDAYFRGRYAYESGTPEGYRTAMEQFRRAVEEEPDFAPALAGLAGARFLIGLEEERVSEMDIEQAHEEAVRALEIDSSSTEAREVLSLIERSMPTLMPEAPTAPAPATEADRAKQVYVFQTPGGVDSVEIDIGPMDTAWLASMTTLGERIEERLRRDPRLDGPGRGGDGGPQLARAARYLDAGRVADAAWMLEEVVDQHPESGGAWLLLTRARASLGDARGVVDAAAAWHETGGPLAPSAEEVASLRDSVARSGMSAYWRWHLGRLESAEQAGRPVPLMELATAHAALGHDDEAVALLVEALERGEPGVSRVRADPAWDELRRDPRMRALAQGLERLRTRRPGPPPDRR